MIYRGKIWLTLGKAAKRLHMSRKSLWELLKRDEEHGFTVLEKVDASGRVWRYLSEEEIRQTLGESTSTTPERQSQVIRIGE